MLIFKGLTLRLIRKGYITPKLVSPTLLEMRNNITVQCLL